MSSTTVLDRAKALHELVSEYAARKGGSAADSELTTALEIVQGAATAIHHSAASLAALEPGGLPREAALAASVLQAGSSAIASDPIAFVRSDSGRAATRLLMDAANALGGDVRQRWDRCREELVAGYPESLVKTLGNISAFRGLVSAVQEPWQMVARTAAHTRAPSAEQIQAARDARRKVDDGLERINAQVPPTIRSALSRAVAGTLRLVDVDEGLLAWIRDNDLEGSFRVRVS